MKSPSVARRASHRRIASFLAVLLLLLPGCKQSSADMQSVRALRKTADDARRSYAALAEDYYASCARRVAYENSSNALAWRLGARAGASRPPAPIPPLQACREQRKASDAWRDADEVVVGYFDALGALAGGDGDKNIDDLSRLSDALAKSDAFSQSGADAVKTLGGAIIARINEAQRAKALTPYVKTADDALGAAMSALQEAAEEHYQNVALRREGAELEAFFNENLLTARRDADAFDSMRYLSAWNDKRKEIDDRREAVAAYVASLQTLREAHARLLKAIGENDRVSACAIARRLAADIARDVDRMNKPLGEQS